MKSHEGPSFPFAVYVSCSIWKCPPPRGVSIRTKRLWPSCDRRSHPSSTFTHLVPRPWCRAVVWRVFSHRPALDRPRLRHRRRCRRSRRNRNCYRKEERRDV